jgi:nodulation protein E
MYRVAVTGLGCISALGHTAEAHWRTARDGDCRIAGITAVDPALLKIKVAAEVRDFDPLAHFDEKVASAYDRFSQFAVIASREAVADSGLTFDSEFAERTAVVTGTGIGGAITIDGSSVRLYREGNRRVHPNTIPKLMPSAATSHITLEHRITGPSFTVTSACSSATHAIGEACWMIRIGRAKAAITGGSEAILTYGSLPAWQALRVMDPDMCRPFDRRRQGMVLGEGAGMLVLEEMESARRRGAHIYAELAGFGLSADAESILEPSKEGATRCLRWALEDARLNPEDVDYINAHGTGTQANDVNETRAIRHVFGAATDRLAVSSTKSMHGHALGGAGALELVLTIKALEQGVVPPTANLEEPDPECDLDYVPGEARDRPLRAALSNSFAFGGLNAVLAVRRVA